MPLNKTRPVLVLSNAKKLQRKALVVECSTKKHKNSIYFYSFISNKTNQKLDSYIAVDRIHTIDSYWLSDKFKIKSHIVPLEIRKQILDYVNSIVNSD